MHDNWEDMHQSITKNLAVLILCKNLKSEKNLKIYRQLYTEFRSLLVIFAALCATCSRGADFFSGKDVTVKCAPLASSKFLILRADSALSSRLTLICQFYKDTSTIPEGIWGFFTSLS
ncbi:hypothetical protein DBV15_05807 [Temnothorax longispinosus]|uniref:Uncharacterized protein n=1 Tax=Temnothorax longispinosus TaxID=300112 RepID=A0A4S2LAS1_9HYME|nr:hypothetical protein DBV15_05807 [Temnothorax longispinosus]